MTEKEMLEAEKYWCGTCCNWDKNRVMANACSFCKLTGTLVFASEIGKDCRFFDVPAENVIVPPCKIGGTLYMIVTKRAKVTGEYFSFIKRTKLTYNNLERVQKGIGKTVFLSLEEARAVLEGGAE